MFLLWKLKKLIAIVLLVASILAFISFGLNFGNVIDEFRAANNFNGYADAVNFTIHILGTPLILLTLGFIALFIPRPQKD